MYSTMLKSPMALLITLSLLTFTSAQNATPNTTTGPIVDLGYARYQSTRNESYNTDAYFGLYYAAPPTGNNRFRAPIPIESQNNYSTLSDPIDATNRGNICIQSSPGYDTSDIYYPQAGDEDCLLLDVLVPSSPANTSLPVWVMIHGGGYDRGDAESYPGWALVNQSAGNLIYVTMQYRLDAFGFLSSSEVRDDGVANAGLLDQRLALDWVQRHISAFGGDPNRVTVAGLSAGGGSVLNQLILYGGTSGPPFSQAIAEYPWWQPYHNETILEAQYQELLVAANCTSGGLACLRSIDSLTLNEAVQHAGVAGYPALYGYGDFYWGPSVDGTIIRDLPSNELKQGHFSPVPLLVDRDAYEGVDFSNSSETTQAEERVDLQSVFPSAKDSFFKRLFQLYPESDFNSTFWQREQIFGDFIISCPTYYMATAFSDAGQKVWKLNFQAGNELHGASVPFLYETSEAQNNNLTLAYVMKDWYLSFAVHGDPNAESWSGVDRPAWEQYSGGQFDFGVMDVNYTMLGMVEDADASARCDFFHAQSYVVRN